MVGRYEATPPMLEHGKYLEVIFTLQGSIETHC